MTFKYYSSPKSTIQLVIPKFSFLYVWFNIIKIIYMSLIINRLKRDFSSYTMNFWIIIYLSIFNIYLSFRYMLKQRMIFCDLIIWVSWGYNDSIKKKIVSVKHFNFLYHLLLLIKNNFKTYSTLFLHIPISTKIWFIW